MKKEMKKVSEMEGASSVIKRYSYFREGRALYIEMNSGKVYMYTKVDIDTFLDFEAATSKGKFYNERIKDVFDWEIC